MAAWDDADHIRIPLLDGTYGTGQITGSERGNPTVLLTLRRTAAATDPITPIGFDEIISHLRTTDAALRDGLWTVPGFEALPHPRDRLSPLDLPDITHDPAIVEAFLNACHGLLGWHSFPDRDLFDTMLFGSTKRPATARSGK